MKKILKWKATLDKIKVHLKENLLYNMIIEKFNIKVWQINWTDDDLVHEKSIILVDTISSSFVLRIHEINEVIRYYSYLNWDRITSFVCEAYKIERIHIEDCIYSVNGSDCCANHSLVNRKSFLKKITSYLISRAEIGRFIEHNKNSAINITHARSTCTLRYFVRLLRE